MFTIYIAKATENFGLPAMCPIYEWFCQTIKWHKCAFGSLPLNASWVSGRIQDWDCMRCLGACRAPTYLQGVTQGEWVPAECLSRSVIMYKPKYIHRGTLPE